MRSAGADSNRNDSPAITPNQGTPPASKRDEAIAFRYAIHAIRHDLYEAAELIDIRVLGIDYEECAARCGIVTSVRAQFYGRRRADIDPSGEPAYACEALDIDGTAIDAVLWPKQEPERFAAALGIAEGLGLNQVRCPATYICGQPLRVHRTPLAWLQADCRGVVIIQSSLAPRWLGEALGAIAAEDVEHARELARLLHGYFDPRRILAPLKRGR